MKQHILLPVAMLAALSACGQSQPEVVGNLPDPQAAELAAAKPVALPAPIKDSRTYRCKDNSLIFVDFLADDMGANLRTEKTGVPTPLKATAKGEPFTAEGGYEVAGNGKSVSITLPGKAKQACTA